MPARPKVPDPQDGAIQAFAYDLRELGHGNVPIPFIASRSDGIVSRAALYAAVSGRRLPSRTTVATLLRWWAGEPSAEDGEQGPFEDPNWGWINRLPPGHEGRSAGQKWRERYARLVRATMNERDWRPVASPVEIPVPVEQQQFIDALRDLIEATGLHDSRWLLFAGITRRVDSYLAGECIPQEEALIRVLKICVDHLEKIDGKTVDALYERLGHLAKQARAARVRERRVARNSRS